MKIALVSWESRHSIAVGGLAAHVSDLAAALQQRDRWRGRSVGVTLCGGNVDRALFARVLAGDDDRGWR